MSQNELRQLIYCDFSDPSSQSKNYKEVRDLNGLRLTVEEFLNEFNRMSKKPMHLVLFRFALEHLSRICRVINQPRGHTLLIGLGGSGRQSLTKLAAHISQYELFQVKTITLFRHQNILIYSIHARRLCSGSNDSFVWNERMARRSKRCI